MQAYVKSRLFWVYQDMKQNQDFKSSPISLKQWHYIRVQENSQLNLNISKFRFKV